MDKSKAFYFTTWALAWRWTLIIALTPIPFDLRLWILPFLVGAAVLVFGFKKRLELFPLIRVILRKDAIVDVDTPVTFPKWFPSIPWLSPAPSTPIVDSASGPGRMTGYEPKYLDRLYMPSSEFMFGVPGSGLNSSDFTKSAIKAGQKGEINFAKSLKKAELLDKYATFWSVGLPSATGFGKSEYDTDVDAVIVTNSTIWLVDLKYYPQGDVTYREVNGELVCFDNTSGNQVKNGKRMTRNMEMALDRYGKTFESRSLNVKAAVVLMPTNWGVGHVQNAHYPGGVPVFMLPEFMSRLAMEGAFIKNGETTAIINTLKTALK